jgi:DNA-binding transcriptional ArsR family regulator
MARIDRSDDNDLLIALAHPLRRQILREMADEEPASPRDLADAIGKPISNVNYHVHVLADCAAVALVGKKPTHGSVQHFYRTTLTASWIRAVLGLPKRDRKDDPPGESSAESGA